VATLVNARQAAGRYNVTWTGTDGNGRPVASGVYFYRIVFDNSAQTRKMLLLK
jgi:flagellar hook assembly protein FlgD